MLWEMADGGKVRIFVNDGRIECAPWMLIEPTTNHLTVLRPYVIGVERGMNAYKPLPESW
jgi:hypothetical protein